MYTILSVSEVHVSYTCTCTVLHVPFGLHVSSAYHMTPRWMDGWMDGWTDGQTDGWMDGWIISIIHSVIMRNSLYMYIYMYV